MKIMTRRVVAFEGKQTVDGRLILPDSLIVKNAKLPVMIYPDKNGVPKVIGRAKVFNRDSATGEISFDITTQHKLSDDLNTHIFLSDLVSRDENGVLVIEYGNIRGIYVSNAAWGWTELPLPGATTDEAEKNIEAFKRETDLANSILRRNRYSTVPPYKWYGPDPEPVKNPIEEERDHFETDFD